MTPSGSLEQAHRRLLHLYEVSKLLTCFDGVDKTIPAIIDMVRRTLPLHTAIFMLETGASPRTIVWHSEDSSAFRLRNAKAHAQTSYTYLVGAAATDVIFDGQPTEISELPGQTPEPIERQNFISLPFAIGHRPIFGALQLEGIAPLDEMDLVFVNAVVNQLAIALGRQAAIDTKQEVTETKRIVAESRQATAEKSEGIIWEELDFTRAVTGSLGEGVLATNLKGRVTLFNPAAAALLGWKEEEAPGKLVQDILQIWRADGMPMTAEESPFNLVLQRGDSFRSEQQLFSGRGREAFAVSYTAVPLRRGGQISGVVLAFQDIRERKQAEHRLRESERQLQFVMDAMPQKIFTAKPNGEADYFNQQWTEFVGLPSGQIKQWGWTQVIHPADLEENLRSWRHSVDTGEAFLIEHRFRRADGLYRWHLSRAHAMRNAEGDVRMWIGSSTDIDDKKRAENAQRLLGEVSVQLLSSPGYRDTLHGIAQFSVPRLADFCVIDEVESSGEVRRVEVMFADETKQRGLADAARQFAPQRGGQTLQAKVIESGESFLITDVSEEDIGRIADDEEHARFTRAVDFKSLIVVPLSARGKTLGAITFVMADSHRRYSATDLGLAQEIAHLVARAVDNARLYEQAQSATRAREDLLAVVSHDLKNPLSVILMSVALMERAALVEDRRKSRKQINHIKHSAERMHRLVQDLLDTASIDAGKLSLVRRRFAITTLVNDTIEAMQPLAQTKSLELKSELPASLPVIFADADRLQQVLTNLVGNAIKFTPAGGTITVRAVEAGDVVEVSVTDTGSGIPEEDIPHVFERFWQARHTARQGTGLGLSIVGGIVAAHGGQVRIESTVGTGSTFFFTLPLALHDAADVAVEGCI